MRRRASYAPLLAAAVAMQLLGGCGTSTPTPTPTPTATLTFSPSPTPTPTPSATSGAVIDVRSYGATGDGSSDDSAAVQKAIHRAARTGASVYVPAGSYACPTSIKLASKVTLRGEGESSWLKGQLVFASGDTVAQLKIGAAGKSALTNAPGASGTSFSDCRFHGGGSVEGVNGSVVYLGGQGSVSDVLFERCEIERTSYVPPSGVDAFADNVGNTVTIHEFTYRSDGAHVEGITFRDCHLGASNGTAKGALRMMVEAYCWDNNTGLVYHGWKDLTFEGCTIEASDTAGLDFADDRLLTGSDPPRHASSGVTISGCTFLGARKHDVYGHGGLPITYECPTGMVITDNTFYASPHEVIGGSKVGKGVTDAPALLIEHNTFDMTRSPVGLTHDSGEPCINLVGYHSRVLDNSFRYDTGFGILIKGGTGASYATVGNLVRGNTFTDTRTTGGEPTVLFADDEGRGCHDNHITANTILNRAAGKDGVIVQDGPMGTNYATDNIIDCGGALPFVVRTGTIERSGNVVRRLQ